MTNAELNSFQLVLDHYIQCGVVRDPTNAIICVQASDLFQHLRLAFDAARCYERSGKNATKKDNKNL